MMELEVTRSPLTRNGESTIMSRSIDQEIRETNFHRITDAWNAISWVDLDIGMELIQDFISTTIPPQNFIARTSNPG
jgi:hypothetical protein